MSEKLGDTLAAAEKGWNEGLELLDKLFSVMRPGAVFSEPVEIGGQTIFTASEVVVGTGFGYGSGGGSGEPGDEAEASDEDEPVEGTGFGAGGGGGGGAMGRPIAAIVIDANGVRVKPIVDVTKVGLAFLTMIGSIFVMSSRIHRAARG